MTSKKRKRKKSVKTFSMPRPGILAAFADEASSHRIALVIIFLCGFGLRLAFLFQPIRLDEAATYVQFASHPLSLGLSFSPAPNNHLLNTFFTHFSTEIFGGSEWAIRLPAFIFGVLVIPVTYLVIRRLLNKYAALFASAFVAFAPIMVSYSVNGRGYSIQVFIFLLLVLLSLDMKEQGINLTRGITFSLLSGLGFYTIPTMLYFWAGLIAWLFLSAIFKDIHGTRRVFIVSLAAAGVASAIVTYLLYLPVILRSSLSAVITGRGWAATGNAWLERKTWSAFISQLPADLRALWSSWTISQPLFISVVLLAGFLISIIFFRRLCSSRVNLPLVLIVSCAAIMFIQRVSSPFARVWLPLFPLYLGFSFAGLFYVFSWFGKSLKKRFRVSFKATGSLPEVLAVVFILAFSFLMITTQSVYQTGDDGSPASVPNVKELIETVSDYMQESDLLCVDGNTPPIFGWTAPMFQYYYERLGLPMSQFAPNQRLDAERGDEISKPDRYLLLCPNTPNTIQVAGIVAEERGLDIGNKNSGFSIIGEVIIGDYILILTKNNTP